MNKGAQTRLPYHYVPFRCSKALHDLVRCRFGIDPNTKFGLFAIRLIDFLMRHSRLDSTEEYLLIPVEILAALSGAKNTNNFRAKPWLDRFSKEVFQLDLKSWDHGAGLSRRVKPPAELEEIQAQVESELEQGGRKEVHFDTGRPITRRTRKVEREGYLSHLLQTVQGSVTANHPAEALIDALNRDTGRVLDVLFKANKKATWQAAIAMPMKTDQQRRRRRHALALLTILEEFRLMRYMPSDKTSRIYALGYTIHLLPRELRKMLLAGTYTLDLKCSQLALASVLWDIPELREALERANETGGGFWELLFRSLGIPYTADNKAVVKEGIYATCFGMGQGNIVREVFIRRLVKDLGHEYDEAQRMATAFLNEPLIMSLFEAREVQIKRLIKEGGGTDAFGKQCPATSRKEARSALAQIMQSHELKVMLSAVPIIQSEARLHVVSWLHDGLTVKIGDTSETERLLRRLQTAIMDEVRAKGIPTIVEIEHR